jgi:hypothetical protein
MTVPLAWLASGKGGTTTDISGRNFRAWSESLDRVGLSVRTFLESSKLPLTTFVRIWSASATPLGFGILKLRLSERGTGGRECSLWRTPKADDPNHGPASEAGMMRRIAKGQSIRLQDQVNHPVLFRTPDAGCARGAQSEERFAESVKAGRLLTLNDQVAHLSHLLPTPKASDANKTTRTDAGLRKQAEGYGLNLPEYTQMFPTPRASDADKGTRTEAGAQKELNRGHGVDLPTYIQMFPTPTDKGNYNRAGASQGSGDGLETFVKLYPTPTCNDAKNNNPPSQRTENGRHSDQLNVVAGGSLNPEWVEWLMGFPVGWTADIGA